MGIPNTLFTKELFTGPEEAMAPCILVDFQNISKTAIFMVPATNLFGLNSFRLGIYKYRLIPLCKSSFTDALGKGAQSF